MNETVSINIEFDAPPEAIEEFKSLLYKELNKRNLNPSCYGDVEFYDDNNKLLRDSYDDND